MSCDPNVVWEFARLMNFLASAKGSINVPLGVYNPLYRRFFSLREQVQNKLWIVFVVAVKGFHITFEMKIESVK